MRRLQIVVADDDDLYLNQLTRYMLQSEAGLEISSFSKQESLKQRLADRQAEKIDILVVAEDMRCAETDQAAAVKVLLVENANASTEDPYQIIPKYQKFTKLIAEILLAYQRAGGDASAFRADTRNARLIGVYSPVGGCGKTTAALLLAHRISRQGKRVFFQSCERVDSTRRLLPQCAQIGFSDIMVALHGKEAGIALLVQSKMHTSEAWGFSYVNAAESALDMDELSAEEQAAYLNELADSGAFDAVIVDFDSELNRQKLTLLQCCDRIVIPVLADALGLSKIESLLHEPELHPELAGLRGRLVFVGSKTDSRAQAYLESVPLFAQSPLRGYLPMSESCMRVGTQGPSNAGSELDGLAAGLLQ